MISQQITSDGNLPGPRSETHFSPVSTCASFWTWLYYEWCFINSRFKREVGVRILGVEFVSFYAVPYGELRF